MHRYVSHYQRLNCHETHPSWPMNPMNPMPSPCHHPIVPIVPIASSTNRFSFTASIVSVAGALGRRSPEKDRKHGAWNRMKCDESSIDISQDPTLENWGWTLWKNKKNFCQRNWWSTNCLFHRFSVNAAGIRNKDFASVVFDHLNGYCTIWGFPKIGVPQNGWFTMENSPLKWMIWGTPIAGNLHIKNRHVDEHGEDDPHMA